MAKRAGTLKNPQLLGELVSRLRRISDCSSVALSCHGFVVHSRAGDEAGVEGAESPANRDYCDALHRADAALGCA